MPVPDAKRPWFVYLLMCKGNRLYAGISPDLSARLALHRAGKGAKFTRAFPPQRLIAAEAHPSRSAASVAEARLKKLRRPAKLLWAADHSAARMGTLSS